MTNGEELKHLREINMMQRKEILDLKTKLKKGRMQGKQVELELKEVTQNDNKNREYILKQEKEIDRLIEIIRQLENMFKFKLAIKDVGTYQVRVDGLKKDLKVRMGVTSTVNCNSKSYIHIEEDVPKMKDVNKNKVRQQITDGYFERSKEGKLSKMTEEEMTSEVVQSCSDDCVIDFNTVIPKEQAITITPSKKKPANLERKYKNGASNEKFVEMDPGKAEFKVKHLVAECVENDLQLFDEYM